MNADSRILSILKTSNLDASITGISSFDLSTLNLASDLKYELPTNLRLGHLAERIVAELIKASTNYTVLYENVQILDDRRTIGELDFIIEEIAAGQLIHMELAYKFYLYDPSISADSVNNWIGPNRNDSLIEKLNKLKSKQFPLLYHECAKSLFADIEMDRVAQSLCFLVSLFVPYEYKGSISPIDKSAIKGYYLGIDKFISLDNPSKSYYIPTKTEWGMDPSRNTIWMSFKGVEKHILACTKEQQAVLCWEKCGEKYAAYFVVWWD